MQDYFGHGSHGTLHQYKSPKDLYREVYFEARDFTINAITTRFDKPNFPKYIVLQELVFKTVRIVIKMAWL